MTEQFIPLISYSKAPTDDRYAAKEERQVETRTRHWMLGWWEDERGRHTVEFGVITEMMPDFCGGILVYSPFVNTFDESSSWGTHFCGPGSPLPEEKIITDWKSFDPAMAVHIEGLCDTSDRKKVEMWAYKCIAAQIAGEMCYHGKRGFMAADYCNGRMTRLLETMQGMGEFLAVPAERFKVAKIDREHLAGISLPTQRRSTSVSVVQFWTARGEDWYNSNSGNQVHWLQGGLRPTDGDESSRGNDVRCSDCDYEYSREWDSECPSCGYDDYYYDDDYDDGPGFRHDSYNYHDALRVINPDFALRARRFFWRNG